MLHKIYFYKKQDHLGNRNKMRRATGETRSNTADCRILAKTVSTVKLQDARRQNNVTKLIEMFEKHQHKEQFPKDMSQKQEINRFSEEPQKLLDDMNQTEIFELCENSAKKKKTMFWLQCLFRTRDYLLQLGEKIEVQAESFNNAKDRLRLYFNPWLLSLRRIPVEHQNMVHLKDRWCFSRRSICLRKQEKRNIRVIRRFAQDGMHKKNTKICWRSTILAKKKSCFSIASLMKDTTFQLRELNGYRTPNIGFFVWMLMGPKSLFDSDQNLPLH